jgi:hypothetical protein
MKIISNLMAKFAKPAPPDTRCVRAAELGALENIPGLGVSGSQALSELPVDQLVKTRTGEVMVPLASFGKTAQQDPESYLGVNRVYGLNPTNASQELSKRDAVLKLQPKDLEAAKQCEALANSIVVGPDGTEFLLCETLPKSFSRNQPYSYLSSEARVGLKNHDMKSFEQLSGLQQGLLGPSEYGEKRWSTEFSPREMKAFLVLTDLWEHPERIDHYSQKKGQQPLDPATLAGLKVTAQDFEGVTLSSIHSDRKHFEITFEGSQESMQRLGDVFGVANREAKGEQTDRGFLADPPYKPFHPDTQMGGGRSPNSHYSLQFMLGEDHGAGDVDMFQPLLLPTETSASEKRSAFVRHWAKHWGEIIVGKNLMPDYMKPDKLASQLGVELYQLAGGH